MLNKNELQNSDNPYINAIPAILERLGLWETPTTFENSTSWYQALKYVLEEMQNKLIPHMQQNDENIKELNDLYNEVVDYVNNYFENLDVQEEINNKLDQMAADGTLANIINEQIFNELNQKIENNTTEINNLKTRRFIFIGDSYANGTSENTKTVKSWVDFCKDLLNLQDNNFYKFAENGAGFVNNGVSGHNFISLLQNGTVENKNTITDIVVCGGINDVNYDYNTIETAMKNFINYCKTEFPNAIIRFGMISNTNDFSTNGMTTREKLNNIMIRLYQLTSCQNGAVYLNGVEKVLKYYYFLSSDNIHPTENGYYFLGAAITQAILTGSVNWSFNEYSNATLVNSNISENNMIFKMKIFDNLLYISCDGGKISFTNDVAEENGIIKLGTLKDVQYFRKNIGNTFAINLSVIIQAGQSNELYSCPAMMNINENYEVYIRPYFYRQDGTGKIGFTGIKYIEFSAFNLSIPLLLS